MKKIVIKQAALNEKKKIVEFIKNHWNNEHILTKEKKIFDYYYVEKKRLNFLIAKDKKKIVGILGFIKDEKYSNEPNSIIWTSILKSLKNYPTIGILLVNKLVNKFKKSDIGCMGNNIQSEKLFKLLGFFTNTLNHYFIINPKYHNFNFVKFLSEKRILLGKKKPNLKISYNFLNKKNISKVANFNFNKKNNSFIINKYLKNKFYNYKIISTNNQEKKIECIIVFRVIKIKNSKCIRVVDCVGNFKNIIILLYLFHELLIRYKAEHLDFYTSLNISLALLKYINKNYFKKNLIVPNYFEPLVQENIKIKYGIYYRRERKKYLFFKGEGDSERPNLI